MKRMHNRDSFPVNLEEEAPPQQGMLSDKLNNDSNGRKRTVSWKRWTLRGLVVALVVALFVGSIWQVVISIGGNPGAIPVDHTHNILSSNSYPVNNHPLIVITNHVGGIFVHGGGVQNQVDVKSLQKQSDTSQNLEEQGIEVTNNQQQSQLIVNVEGPQDIAVGTFDVDVTIAGDADLVLNSLSGDIKVAGVMGSETVTTDGGTINMSETSLQKSSKIISTNGSIFFDGQVDRLGSATFHSDAGDLNLRLPHALPLDLRASSVDGKVTHDSNVTITGKVKGSASGIYVSLGDFPRASVTADSVTGSVNVGLG